mmetsp:Transcript_15315/g.46371  ORF Transcript_15315/g.46371 Transcript_15315/m.46371 type:complete len:311 (-) Transcript_15315:294-1226(-)
MDALSKTQVAGLVVVLVSTVVVYLMQTSAKKKKRTFLDKTRQKVTLLETEQLSPDTKRLRFALPSPDMVLGLPVGKHFKVFCPNVKKETWNGRPDPERESDEIERKYTPVSSDDDAGFVDLVIKVYEPLTPRFPDGGKMSQHVNALKPGQTLDISGPWGVIAYEGRGSWAYAKRQIQDVRHVGMMAGGTGITPMLQIIAAVLKDAKDSTKLSLIFANQTEADILVRDHLETLQTKHPDRFHLWYTLDRPPANGQWNYGVGFIDRAMIAEHLPPPSDHTLVLMCGPPPMIQFACKKNLDDLNYPKNRQLAF